MDKNFKAVLIFTAFYGVFALAALVAQPWSASLRVADAIGNFEADPPGSVSLVLAAAE